MQSWRIDMWRLRRALLSVLVGFAFAIPFVTAPATRAKALQEEAGQAPASAEQAPGPSKAYLILAKGPVNSRLTRHIRQELQKAAASGAQAAILEIDTFGGELDAAVAIRDALLDAPLLVIAFVNKRSISAGALIALASHEIVMAPGATIGAATPVRLTWTGSEPAGEKAISYFRKEMKATAESRNHPGALAEAMVDTDVVVPEVVEKGKLLTLTTQEALTLKLAAAKSEDLEQLLETYKLELVAENRKEAARAAEAVDARGWFEQFRAWHVWLLLGLTLVVVEILIPAFFVLWFGVGASVAALLAFLGMSQAVQVSAFLAISFLLLVFSRTIFQSTLFRSKQSVATNVEALRGQQAIVLKAMEGSLQPGSVKIGGEVWSAICEEETQILEGAKVEVLDVVGNKVRVKPI